MSPSILPPGAWRAGGGTRPRAGTGPAAESIADLWWLFTALGAAVFVLVVALLVIPMVRRARAEALPAPAEHGEVPEGLANRWIVWLGIVLPTVVLGVALFASVLTMRDLPRRGDGLVIDVVGRQFWWSAHYRDAGVTVANEIHVPVGERVELHLTSADVIHSVWVPALNGKLDALPDDTNVLVIEADEAGTYRGACTEFCGLQHANMGLVVVAHPAAEFETWIAAQQQPAAEPASEAAARGREVFAGSGCATCHTVREDTGDRSDGDGPDLTHLASRSSLAADTVDNDRANLTTLVTDPHSIKDGITMPPTELSGEELADLVAYLEGLE